MAAPTKLSPSLAALMSAAAALSPAAHAQSAAETESHASYRFNEYGEDAFDGRAIGSPERYEVFSQQFELDTHVGIGNRIDVGLTHEVMSGSSPWYVLPGPGNKPVQVLSGATIREHRSEARLAYTTGADTSSATTYSASYSQERDYHATALGFERSIPLSNALTLGAGGSFSHDLIRPTDAIAYDRIVRAQKNTGSLFGSLAWVLDKSSVVQTGVQFNVENGYLSDPYKLVSIGDAILPDKRPGSRVESAWLVRYRHAFAHPEAALHLDYRYAQDSWGVVAHTVDVGWYQNLGDGWELVPAARYYSQQQARFYAPFFLDAGAHTFYTSDYRLGTFGAFSASLNVRKRIARWQLSAGVERYHASTDYALGGADAPVPGVLSYTRAFIGLDYLLD
ncbi:MAG TPA: DUF3570 domain-containing protein [Rudaea sp.]|nr:DUF3570 domain-containing protein [Rudaea sp.]